MTHIFTFSGVHGSGKTTIINHIANRLTNIGKKVFVLNEFPYIPEVSMGTMDFQAWYQNSMEQRSEVVRKIASMFDVILLDRHPLDVDVYSSRLLDTRIPFDSVKSKVFTMHLLWEGYESYSYISRAEDWKEYSGMFVIERSLKDLLESLQIRKLLEGHRSDWGEEDKEYLTYIIETFRLFKKNPNTILIENEDLKDTKDLVFKHITQRIKE